MFCATINITDHKKKRQSLLKGHRALIQVTWFIVTHMIIMESHMMMLSEFPPYGYQVGFGWLASFSFCLSLYICSWNRLKQKLNLFSLAYWKHYGHANKIQSISFPHIMTRTCIRYLQESTRHDNSYKYLSKLCLLCFLCWEISKFMLNNPYRSLWSQVSET